eukprot:scaffold16968_cov94-Amphora_coffeaeformis.AAC.3
MHPLSAVHAHFPAPPSTPAVDQPLHRLLNWDNTSHIGRVPRSYRISPGPTFRFRRGRVTLATLPPPPPQAPFPRHSAMPSRPQPPTPPLVPRTLHVQLDPSPSPAAVMADIDSLNLPGLPESR